MDKTCSYFNSVGAAYMAIADMVTPVDHHFLSSLDLDQLDMELESLTLRLSSYISHFYLWKLNLTFFSYPVC